MFLRLGHLYETTGWPEGESNPVRIVGQAVPTGSRMPNVADAMFETMNIAVGATFGCLLSVPLALLAERNTVPPNSDASCDLRGADDRRSFRVFRQI